jgi:hypothetical protein
LLPIVWLLLFQSPAPYFEELDCTRDPIFQWKGDQEDDHRHERREMQLPQGEEELPQGEEELPQGEEELPQGEEELL